MGLAILASRAHLGMDAPEVAVEVNIAGGLPGMSIVGLPEAAVQVIATPDRAAVGELIAMQEYVDVIVPRGVDQL